MPGDPMDGGLPKTPAEWRALYDWNRPPEFLPTSDCVHIQVGTVSMIKRWTRFITVSGPGDVYEEVYAPHFAAWLDRLGIPWTEELRKAHAEELAMREKGGRDE